MINIPAGVSHFHGSTKNSRFQQIVIYDKNRQTTEDLKPHVGSVTDEEYNGIKFQDAENNSRTDQEFIFRYSAKPFESPNFNQPVYLGKVLGKENVANSREWIYVDFPKGTYNRWQSQNRAITDCERRNWLSSGQRRKV